MTKRSYGAVWFLLLALTLIGATVAIAGDADCAVAHAEAADSTTAEVEADAAHAEMVGETANAMRVVIDAETGRLRAPTAAEMAAFAAGDAPARDIESMRVEKAADGTMTVRLGGAFLKAAIAQVTPDGRVEVKHDAVPAVDAPAVELAAETIESEGTESEATTVETADIEENH